MTKCQIQLKELWMQLWTILCRVFHTYIVINLKDVKQEIIGMVFETIHNKIDKVSLMFGEWSLIS